MSLYLKWCGIALIMIAAISVSRSIKGYVSRRISETESFVSLLTHIEGQVSRYLKPPSEIFRDFEDKYFIENGFIDAISGGEQMLSVFSRIARTAALGEEAKRVLFDFFHRFGQGYRDEELKLIRETEARLSEILREERDALSKNEKTISALVLAAALGAAILLI